MWEPDASNGTLFIKNLINIRFRTSIDWHVISKVQFVFEHTSYAHIFSTLNNFKLTTILL